MSKNFKQTFESLYSASKELMDSLKKPFVLKKNLRAVESAIDSAELQKITAEEDLEKALLVIKTGDTIDVNKILKLRQTIKSADLTIAELNEFKAEFFELK